MSSSSSSSSFFSSVVVVVVVGVAIVVDGRLAHLYDNGTVSFVHNSNVSLTMYNSSLFIDSLSDQPLYLTPSSCRLRNSTAVATALTTVCGTSKLLNLDNANLLDKVSSESYELLIRRRERYLLKGHKSNYSLLVAFDDHEGCWLYLIDNRDCHNRNFLRQLCYNLPSRLIDSEGVNVRVNDKPRSSNDDNNEELRTLYNISVLMIAIDCIAFVLYISLIVFMIKLLRNAYESRRCGDQFRRAITSSKPSDRFYLVRATGNETLV